MDILKFVNRGIEIAGSRIGQATVVVGTTMLSAQVHAASHLPAATALALTTDMTDTQGSVMTFVWGIFPIVAIGWFAFNQARKGAGKFGAK